MSRPLRAALLSLALGVTSVLPAAAADGQTCPGLDSGRVEASGSPMTVTVDAPAGQLITLYCVASVAGNDSELIAVDPGVATLLLSHTSGTGIADWSVAYGTVPAAADDAPADLWWPTTPAESGPAEDPALPAPAVEPESQSAAAAPPAAAEAPSNVLTPTVDASPKDTPTIGEKTGPRAASTATPGSASSSTASSSTAPRHVLDPSGAVLTASPLAPQSAAPEPSDGSAVADRAGTPLADSSPHDVPGSGATSASPATPITGEVRRAGLSVGGAPGALATALLMLAMLGSAGAVLHVARRESGTT